MANGFSDFNENSTCCPIDIDVPFDCHLLIRLKRIQPPAIVTNMAKGTIKLKLPHAPMQLTLLALPACPKVVKSESNNKIVQNGTTKDRITNFFMPVIEKPNPEIKTEVDIPLRMSAKTTQLQLELRSKVSAPVNCSSAEDKSSSVLKTNSSSGVNWSDQNSRLFVERKSPVAVVSTPLKPASRSKRKVNHSTGVRRIKISPGKNRQLTEYFPIRRSCRQTRTLLMKEKQNKVTEILLSGKEEGLREEEMFGKGRGVIATRAFKKGEFVVEYSGDLIDFSEAKHREKIYAQDQNTGCYMYYFAHNNRRYCVDATEESGRLGRLINHSRNGNLVTKAFTLDDVPRLILIAKQDIKCVYAFLHAICQVNHRRSASQQLTSQKTNFT